MDHIALYTGSPFSDEWPNPNPNPNPNRNPNRTITNFTNNLNPVLTIFPNVNFHNIYLNQKIPLEKLLFGKSDRIQPIRFNPATFLRW